MQAVSKLQFIHEERALYWHSVINFVISIGSIEIGRYRQDLPPPPLCVVPVPVSN
jgi:hypothetical protein